MAELRVYAVTVEARPGDWKTCRPIRATTLFRALHTARILYRRRAIQVTGARGRSFVLQAGDPLPNPLALTRAGL
jgi:hypothetical protein